MSDNRKIQNEAQGKKPIFKKPFKKPYKQPTIRPHQINIGTVCSINQTKQTGLIQYQGSNRKIQFQFKNFKGVPEINQAVSFEERRAKKNDFLYAVKVQPIHEVDRNQPESGGYVDGHEDSISKRIYNALKNTNIRDNEFTLFTKRIHDYILNKGQSQISEELINERATAVEKYLIEQKPDTRDDNFWNTIEDIIANTKLKKAENTDSGIQTTTPSNNIPKQNGISLQSTEALQQQAVGDDGIKNADSMNNFEQLFARVLTLEKELSAKEKKLSDLIDSLKNEKKETSKYLKQVREEIKYYKKMVSSAQHLSSSKVPTEVHDKKELIESEKYSPSDTPKTPILSKEPESQQETQIQAEQQLDIQAVHNKVLDLISNNKTSDAIDLVRKEFPKKIPSGILISLYKTLERPGYNDPKVEDAILKMMNDAMSVPPFKKGSEYFAQQRNLVTLYGRTFTIRNYKAITRILQYIVKTQMDGVSHRLHLAMTIPSLKMANYLVLAKCQNYLAAFLVAQPKKSYRLLKIYEKVKRKIVSEEEHRTEFLRKESAKTMKFKKNEVSEPTKENAEMGTESTQSYSVNEEQIESQQKTFQEALKIMEKDTNKLSEEALKLFESLQPTKEEVEQRIVLCKNIEIICKNLFGGRNIVSKHNNQFVDNCKVHLYGSSENNFGLKNSDVDMCVQTDEKELMISDIKMQQQLLILLSKAINEDESMYNNFGTCTNLGLEILKNLHTISEIPDQSVIKSARVPVLKLVEKELKSQIDVCIGNYLGVVNTKMLQTYSKIDPRVRPLTYVVKYWTKRRKINNASCGSLSSYTYLLMVIFYLQQLNPPILPSLQEISQQEGVDKSCLSEPQFVNAYDCRYFNNLEKLNLYWKREQNKMTLAELICGFFKFYSEFDFDESTISIRVGKSLPKKRFGSEISVEDPFEKRDLGMVLAPEVASIIISEFKRAYEILSKEGGLEELCKEREDKEESRFTVVKENYEEHIPVEEAKKLLESGELHKGVLRVNKKRFREAYVEVEGFPKDVLIDGFKARNRALHGDIVAIKINKKSETEITGTVVCILEKRSPNLFACYLMKEDEGTHRGFRWLLPIDKAFPKIMVNYEEFRHVFDSKANCLEDLIFVCEMTGSWRPQHHYPKGRVIATLGLRKDLWSQKRALLLQNFPNIFDDIYKNNKTNKTSGTCDVPNISDVDIDKDMDLSEYKDWRKRCIFTIDPPTSRDLDDALSIQQIGDDEYQCAVYVADVSRWVNAGDHNDLDAKKRATSVYMIDTVEHMLPPQLSQGVCSLHAGVTRYAFAVEWKMDSKGNVKQDSVEFNRGIICSCWKGDYDTVQNVIEGKVPPKERIDIKNGFTWDRIKNDILMLHKLSRSLRNNRKQTGSLFLSSQDVTFETNEDGYPIKCIPEIHNEAHELVEEFMLLANQLVAKKLYDFDPKSSLLRYHSPPKEKNWIPKMSKLADAYNKIIPPSKQKFDFEKLLLEKVPSQQIMNQLFEFMQDDPIILKTVQNELRREMQLAKYCIPTGDPEETKSLSHYALNIPFYTHFTSPIRRYADIVVHRLLLNMIKSQQSKEKPHKIDDTELRDLVKHINDQAYKAKTVEDQCQRMYLAHYLIPILSEQLVRVEAVIVSLGKRSFTVYIPSFCVELNVSIMKTFSPVPDSIVDVESPEKCEKHETVIESLTLLWKPENYQERSIKLHMLKTVLLDLDVNYESLPYDIYAFNVWEVNQRVFTKEKRHFKPRPPIRYKKKMFVERK